MNHNKNLTNTGNHLYLHEQEAISSGRTH